jgi:hypothetical protein
MFVLMIQGHPLSASLPEEPGLGERFWYWYGASGRRYIHSIYCIETCPPVPGAVFVAVNRRGGTPRAVSAGRFPAQIASNTPIKLFGRQEVEEIHVHLLARDDEGAQSVLGDLLAAMDMAVQPMAGPGVQTKPAQLDMLAA